MSDESEHLKEQADMLDSDKRRIGTVDLTPTWAGVINVYIGVLENPSARPEAREAARSEIRRMATIADGFTAIQEQLSAALNSGANALDELRKKIQRGE